MSLSIQATPPNSRMLADASDGGSNSSVTGKQPAVDRVFSTSMSVDEATRYYVSAYGTAYHLSQLPGVEGSQVLDGHLNLDSVTITISPNKPILEVRPRAHVIPDGSPTYISVFAIG
jgi:hypothetical protein